MRTAVFHRHDIDRLISEIEEDVKNGVVFSPSYEMWLDPSFWKDGVIRHKNGHEIKNDDDILSALFRDELDKSLFNTEKVPPSIILVKDHGLYLMSSRSRKKSDDFEPAIIYAGDCNPKTDSDWYNTARYIAGDDDFGEYLPLEDFNSMDDSVVGIAIDFTDDQLFIKHIH